MEAIHQFAADARASWESNQTGQAGRLRKAIRRAPQTQAKNKDIISEPLAKIIGWWGWIHGLGDQIGRDHDNDYYGQFSSYGHLPYGCSSRVSALQARSLLLDL